MIKAEFNSNNCKYIVRILQKLHIEILSWTLL